jgi:ATP adenylyltransferase
MGGPYHRAVPDNEANPRQSAAQAAGAGVPTPAPVTDASLGHGALQAPWRYAYLESLDEPGAGPAGGGAAGAGGSGSAAGGGGGGAGGDTNFLARYWAEPARDVQNHVVVRGRAGLILLNAYPYANGHLLVALAEPRARLMDYSPEQRAALWSLVDAAADLVETALQPQGLNIGINQGRAAGAGVPQHLHVHVVPRWGGDINFTTVVARVRVIPASLEAMASRYRAAWPRVAGRHAGVLG